MLFVFFGPVNGRLRPWRSSGFRPTGPGANRRAEFPVPSLWAKLLEEIRLRHSSAERRPGIADVKNGVPGRVRSGLCVTELGNFCSGEHPLREVSAVTFWKVFGMVVTDFGYCSCARLQNVSRGFFFFRIVFVCSQNGHHL